MPDRHRDDGPIVVLVLQSKIGCQVRVRSCFAHLSADQHTLSGHGPSAATKCMNIKTTTSVPMILFSTKGGDKVTQETQ